MATIKNKFPISGAGKKYFEFEGISTEEKPVGPEIADASVFYEIDTKTKYRYFEETWVEEAESGLCTGISVETEPDTISYIAGEVFDPTGITIYQNFIGRAPGQTESYIDVTESVVYSPSTELTLDDTEIEISYTDSASKTYKCTQRIYVEVELELSENDG